MGESCRKGVANWTGHIFVNVAPVYVLHVLHLAPVLYSLTRSVQCRVWMQTMKDGASDVAARGWRRSEDGQAWLATSFVLTMNRIKQIWRADKDILYSYSAIRSASFSNIVMLSSGLFLKNFVSRLPLFEMVKSVDSSSTIYVGHQTKSRRI